MPLADRVRRAGCSRAAARSSARRARIPYKTDDGPRAREGDARARPRRRAHRDRRRGHARRRAQARRATACTSSACPKTIDNDLSATDFTFGFHTAVQIATDAIDRLHTTAESHDRVMVVEVMGRHAGWIATYSGLAGGADMILVPESRSTSTRSATASRTATSAARTSRSSSSPKARRRSRARWSCRPARSTSSATCASAASATALADEIEQRTGFEARMTQLGHLLRGGSPTRVRPGDRDPLRDRGDRRRARGRLRRDGRAARHRRRPRPDRRRASRS